MATFMHGLILAVSLFSRSVMTLSVYLSRLNEASCSAFLVQYSHVWPVSMTSSVPQGFLLSSVWLHDLPGVSQRCASVPLWFCSGCVRLIILPSFFVLLPSVSRLLNYMSTICLFWEVKRDLESAEVVLFWLESQHRSSELSGCWSLRSGMHRLLSGAHALLVVPSVRKKRNLLPRTCRLLTICCEGSRGSYPTGLS